MPAFSYRRCAWLAALLLTLVPARAELSWADKTAEVTGDARKPELE